MNENDFHEGSIIRGGESVYVKESLNSWMAYDLEEVLTSNEVQEVFDDRSPYAVKFEVIYKPDPSVVLEELPSGSVVVSGDSVVAIKYEQDWSVSGSADWYSSRALLKNLGGRFEVVRRGEAD